MGVASYEPVPPGRELVRRWPRTGLLLRLVPQRRISEPGVQWTGRSRPAWFDVTHDVLGGVDAGRTLGASLRTHVQPGDGRLLALAHLADRLSAAYQEPSGSDPRWAPVRAEVDGRAVPAVQGVADGHELIVLPVGDRLATIVTDVLDAARFEPRYATFRPWSEDQTSEA